MHAEYVEVGKKTLENIIKAKLEGRRIIAVGTTSVRVLEALAKFSIFNFQINKFSKKTKDQKALRVMRYELCDYAFWTDIFIYPGFKFKIVDAMITNFHLPKSTLLMLVSAFAEAPADKSAFANTERSRGAGRNKIFKAYQEAIKKKYRFFSYGDAMLIM
jgi:S-adenosylmethionine:tRNA ribosyltransferase-isomerase